MRVSQLSESITYQQVSGVISEALPYVIIDSLIKSSHQTSFLLVNQASLIEDLLPQLRFWLNISNPKTQWNLFPFPPIPQEDPDSPLPESVREELECDRVTALSALSDTKRNQGALILTTPDALFSPLPPQSNLNANAIKLSGGSNVGFQSLIQSLVNDLDYDSEAICERPGQFAVRGGLIDVYPINAPEPYRLDFFGDDLEGIRSFDPTTQRSLELVPTIIIHGKNAFGEPNLSGTIDDYLTDSTLWLFHEANQVIENHSHYFQEFERVKGINSDWKSLVSNSSRQNDEWLFLQELEITPPCLPSDSTWKNLPFESLEPYRSQPLEADSGMERLEQERLSRESFYDYLEKWQSNGTKLIGLVSNEGSRDEILRNLSASHHSLKIEFIYGDIPSGFRWNSSSSLSLFKNQGPLAIITEREWMGRHSGKRALYRRRKLPLRSQVDHLLDFSELNEGDYLVHLAHGICRFKGIHQMEHKGRLEEMITVEFADNITLYVPFQDAHLLTRYVGLTTSHPKLGRLGSGVWEKTRAAAEKATFDFAAELISIQAKRADNQGIQFSADNDWQLAFERAFPYRETKDQLIAIQETKADMEKAQPMDRLICGDVGFGKTEVAIRSAFKAVQDGYQVALLVPTTVLAQQHFDTFQTRFSSYPVSVEMLSRFRSASEQKKIIDRVERGEIDVLIGTHRLFSGDVRFKNLGLLIIDEEHRFGVRHKEKLKQFRAEIDVLTMSATPIPRTLYFALMGARDLSVIETPPADRLPIETIVRNYDEDLIKKAIQRELNRGGQVFYLHNRVQSIEGVSQRIQKWIPNAKVAIGHGQMTENALEKVMAQFVAGKWNVLVCTTIIENGLDIPNCNTILIESADRFGLSQLYQLRGRVGRFNRQAYAYLLLHRHGKLLDIARKRLGTMRQHNQLGAGFKIAMRDLELRGAGNLLGVQQSGHIAGVGFDLYCNLLRQSVQRLKGEAKAIRIRASVKLDFIQQGPDDDRGRSIDTAFDVLKEEEIARSRIKPVEAGIPADYLPETRLRIEFYRRLALAQELTEIDTIETDLIDRFGPLPTPLKYLVAITRVRVRAELAGVLSVETEGDRLKCRRASGKKNDYIQINGRFPRLTANKPHLRLRDIEQFLARHRQ